MILTYYLTSKERWQFIGLFTIFVITESRLCRQDFKRYVGISLHNKNELKIPTIGTFFILQIKHNIYFSSFREHPFNLKGAMRMVFWGQFFSSKVNGHFFSVSEMGRKNILKALYPLIKKLFL